MDLSRRSFLGAAAERQDHPERVPVLLGRLRPPDPHRRCHIVDIEGDPRSPHNEGTLCPKGAATTSST